MERRRAVETLLAGGGSRQDADRLAAWYDEREAAVLAKCTNMGTFAAYLGYDAVLDLGAGVCLVVNRTAVRVQREDIV
jgi:hypothetical protein